MRVGLYVANMNGGLPVVKLLSALCMALETQASTIKYASNNNYVCL